MNKFKRGLDPKRAMNIGLTNLEIAERNFPEGTKFESLAGIIDIVKIIIQIKK